MSIGSTRSSRVSDWVGFICFCAFALNTLSKMPAVGFLMIPTMAFEIFVAISFLTREPARAAAPSARGRVSAYVGTFLILAFLQVARRAYPHWLTPTDLGAFQATGALLWTTGWIWSAYALWHLRRAFSIEPEARRLITSGPYGLARHPVYTGYLAQYVGMWFLYPTTPLAAVLLGWFLVTADRMRHEERVLSNTFPEYADYRRRVGALGSFWLREPAEASSIRGLRMVRDRRAMTKGQFGTRPSHPGALLDGRR